MPTDFSKKRVAVLGAGKMGGILLKALLEKQLFSSKTTVATVQHEEKARTLGKKRAGQELGNLMSRLDFACYLAGLPSIGCTAEKPFADAWQQQHRSWKWPVKKMRAASKAHSWSSADFDLMLQETQQLSYGLGQVAWNDEHAKNDNKIMAWAGV